MKNAKSTILATMMVLMVSGTAFAKSGTISATQTGTISATKTGTISGTRTGTISGTVISSPSSGSTSVGRQSTITSNPVGFGVLELVLRLYQLW